MNQIPRINLTLATILSLSLGALSSLSAQSIEAGFSESTSYSTSFTSDNEGEQTAVDQWSGTPGRGWTSGWMVETNASSVRDKQVQGMDGPTGGEGRYVQFRMQVKDKQSRIWINSRSYGSYGDVDVNGRVRYEFLYRADDISGFASGGTTYLQIKDGGAMHKREGTTWLVTTSGGTTKRWMFANGDGNGDFKLIDSGVEIVEGNTYKFTILADPTIDQWGIAVDNLDNSAAQVVEKDLNFVNASSSQAGKLIFLTQLSSVGDGTADYQYSLDSIKISAGQ